MTKSIMRPKTVEEELAEAKAIIANYDTIRDTDRANHQTQIEQRVAQIDNLHTALDEISQAYEAEHAARVMLTKKIVEVKADREALIKSFNERFAFKEEQIEELMDDNQKLKVQITVLREAIYHAVRIILNAPPDLIKDTLWYDSYTTLVDFLAMRAELDGDDLSKMYEEA